MSSSPAAPRVADRYESSDEENWTTARRPLLNTHSWGWAEDGRCGYPTGNRGKYQDTPRPIGAFDLSRKSRNSLPYLCKKAVAGSRHSIFLMIHCRRVADQRSADRRRKKVMLTGLNQGLLCEEEGYSAPVDLFIEEEFYPVDVEAGLGCSFVLDKFGNVYSFGIGRHGVLGHGDEDTSQIPRQIRGLLKERVRLVSAGDFHVVALTYHGKLYSWGRNNRGQLGDGTESEACRCTPGPVEVFEDKRYFVMDISCGDDHTSAIVRVTKKTAVENTYVYAWGDDAYLQLGSCDSRTRSTPTEVRWVTKYLAKKVDGALPYRISCGGGHNLLLTAGIGRVISWGRNGYGQLGQGDTWDCAQPRMLVGLIGVEAVFAGKRHSAAIVSKPTADDEERKARKREKIFADLAQSSGGDEDSVGSLDSLQRGKSGALSPERSPTARRKTRRATRKSLQQKPVEIADDGESPRVHKDVFVWGYNAYGELGLGDTSIRLTPTLVTALQNARVRDLSLGDRHTIAITDHVPMLVKDVPDLKPFFDILKHNVSRTVKNVLVGQIAKLGYPGSLLDTPSAPYSDQPGYSDEELLNVRYEEGLRYCMDTIEPKPELAWQRKGIETCYVCPPLKLTAVCLACARRCQKERLLVPRIRSRGSNDACDCRTSGLCRCSYSHVREQFDRLITPYTGHKDECIGPRLLRTLLENCLHPMPVENSDMEECLISLSEGDETADVPRITPWAFEKWYNTQFHKKKK